MRLIAANWKSHKTTTETKEFFNVLSQNADALRTDNTEILICPSYTSLVTAHTSITEKNLPVLLGAQNVSPFPQGAYTGEVTADQIAEFASHVIIGHSERRDYFEELEHMIELKVKQAKAAGLTVILCVQDEDATVYDGVDIVAYEPVSAIGTGNPDDPAHVSQVLAELHARYPSVTLLYGGSVDTDSISHYLSIDLVQGFLIGGASLDPNTLLQLVSLCENTKN